MRIANFHAPRARKIFVELLIANNTWTRGFMTAESTSRALAGGTARSKGEARATWPLDNT